MLLFLSLLGVFLSVLLLYYNAKNNNSTVFLGVFFFLISLYLFTEYVLFYSRSIYLISIVYIHSAFLSYLTGPMFFWYVRSVLTDNSKLSKRDFWHLVPMLLFFVTEIPYFFIPFQKKLEIAAQFIKDPNLVGTYHPIPLYNLLGSGPVFLSRPLLIMGYTIFSASLIVTYIGKKRTDRVLTGQKFMIKWLSVLTLFLLIFILCHLLEVIETIKMKDIRFFLTLNILQSISGLGMTGLLISPFFFPNILYGLPKLPEGLTILSGKKAEEENPKQEVEKYTLKFELFYLQSIAEKAETCMKEKQPYLSPHCNLAYFSNILQIPVHHVAYYFREIKKQSFTDYRNEWRVKHARKLIEEGNAHKLTFETIGQLSGFSSRNAFFTAFKKMEGITPGMFAGQISD